MRISVNEILDTERGTLMKDSHPAEIVTMLSIFGAPQDEIRLITKKVLETDTASLEQRLTEAKLNPSDNIFRKLLHRDLGFDPGSLTRGMQSAAKRMYFSEMYGATRADI